MLLVAFQVKNSAVIKYFVFKDVKEKKLHVAHNPVNPGSGNFKSYVQIYEQNENVCRLPKYANADAFRELLMSLPYDVSQSTIVDVVQKWVEKMVTETAFENVPEFPFLEDDLGKIVSKSLSNGKVRLRSYDRNGHFVDMIESTANNLDFKGLKRIKLRECPENFYFSVKNEVLACAYKDSAITRVVEVLQNKYKKYGYMHLQNYTDAACEDIFKHAVQRIEPSSRDFQEIAGIGSRWIHEDNRRVDNFNSEDYAMYFMWNVFYKQNMSWSLFLGAYRLQRFTNDKEPVSFFWTNS